MDTAELDAFIIDLMDLFHKKQDLEEKALQQSKFGDVTVKELHTVIQIGIDKPKTHSDVAQRLNVTTGTLSVAINRLVKKGYVQRERDPNDRRVVYLSLTHRGRVLYRLNMLFYRKLVKRMAKNKTEDELKIMVDTMQEVYQFILDTYELIDNE